MDNSTFDRAVIRATADRAVGHAHPYPKPPVDVPMTAAGGLYASAADLARFLRCVARRRSGMFGVRVGPRGFATLLGWARELDGQRVWALARGKSDQIDAVAVARAALAAGPNPNSKPPSDS
jgi:CubicO group peptidase (beta-lactamase class C family)